jgi:outer membrane protein assembly factor BamD (BamD/ComL family)
MKKHVFIITATILFAAAVVFLFPSCGTVEEIPHDLSAAQLIQLGQDAYGKTQYKNAEIYYRTVISRYGMDNSIYIEARYELGHLYIKEKKYDDAYTSLKEIIDLYASTTPGTLSGAFNKLAQIEMAKIPTNKLPETKETAVNAAPQEKTN